MGVQLAKKKREKTKTRVKRVLCTLFSPIQANGVLLREVLVQKGKLWVRQTLDFLLEHIMDKGLENGVVWQPGLNLAKSCTLSLRNAGYSC